MNSKIFHNRHLISTFLCLGMLIGSTSLTVAEPSNRQQRTAMTQTNNSGPSLTDRGTPEGQTPKASRGSCSSGIDSQELVAYIPSKTVEGYPNFQFQVPFKSQEFHSVEFRLVEADNLEAEMLYETQLSSNQVSSDLEINLPENASALEVNKSYEWKLIIYCSDPSNINNIQDTIFVEGSITRVQLTAESEK
ncbi:MAG: DUF928 domain-containing protein [Cyanobacteriota bacterium]|nr:DUF928 domain-containing protein [Cyanobacteriota bacterium]